MGKDIQILGCGITGMMMALALAHHKIPSVILERTNSETFPHDVRTTAFTRKVQKYLAAVGIWDLFAKDAGEIKDIYVVDNRSPRILHMGHEEADLSVMGYIVPNDLIKARLYEAAKKEKLIEVRKGVKLPTSVIPAEAGAQSLNNKNWVPARDDNMTRDDNMPSTNDIPLTLICDGRASLFRRLFETRIDKDYGQNAIVLVTEHEKPHECVAVEHFMSSGPFASLPMQDPHHSSVVWTEKRDIALLYSKMDKAELEAHLQEKFGEFLGKVKIISKVQTFPLTAAITKTYVKNNLVLVGDVAHAIHPLAGQGLNQGIKDIEELTNIIVKRLENGLEVDDLALQEYERTRMRDNFNMFLFTDNINRIFSNDIKSLGFFRKIGLSLFDQMSILKRRIAWQ